MYRTIASQAVQGSRYSTISIAHRVAKTSSPALLQARNLVSTVLLGSDAYQDKKVTELKSELKQRKLSTSGNRTQLIDRLKSSDEHKSKVLPQPMHIRNASTKDAPPQESLLINPSEGAVGTSTDKATISHPPDIQPGQVSSNQAGSTWSAEDGITQSEILEAAAAVPGVPPEKVPRVPIVFDVKIPYEKIVADPGPEIPLMTAYFHPEEPLYKGFHPAEEGIFAHLPKVMTASGEDTYLGGGPSHHNANFDLPDMSKTGILKSGSNVSSDGEDYTISSAINSMFKTMKDDLGFKVDPALEKTAQEVSKTTVESTRTLLKEARDSLSASLGPSSSLPGSGSSRASYSTTSYSGSSDRPLNDEERRGLYILGGIVIGGFLLGGLGKPSKRRIEKVKNHIAEEAEQVKKQIPVLPDEELSSLVKKAEGALKGV